MFNNYLLDGMDNNAYGESNQGFDNQIIAIPPDSVAQFKVVTNNESAEYGRSSGCDRQRGIRERHESLSRDSVRVHPQHRSERGRDSSSRAWSEQYRDRQCRSRSRPSIATSSAMNFGGPIVTNKLFFFLDYEGFRQTLRPLMC